MTIKKRKNILLIGFGPHSKRIYYPLIEKLSNKVNIKLVAAIDLEEKKQDLENYFSKRESKVDLYFIKNKYKTNNRLHVEVRKLLNKIVEENKVEGVIIATEPLTHAMYAKWALRNNLSILMDKPISTYKNISTNMRLSKKVVKDFDTLAKMYIKARKKNSKLTFTLMAQRRFHPAFKKMKELIKDCFIKTGCPVTSIQSFHCDGQWRMPTEIIDQLYHPYMQGYGKCSHSGYHFFDIVPYLLMEATDNKKYYDNIEVFTNFTRPQDFIEQLTFKDYEKLFGKTTFNKYNKYSLSEFNKLSKRFGEIDAFTNIAFKKGNRTITLASINLSHNGFSQRNWVTAKGRDLYKGNGRIRHESHIIEQGPFQSIQYNSYQSKEVDIKNNRSLYKIGGEYHLEVVVFRNTKMIGGKAVEVFDIKDLNINILVGKSRGHQEDARARGFIEFAESINGKISQEKLTSDFLTHRPAALITSGIYQSAVKNFNRLNPKINLKFKRLNRDLTLYKKPFLKNKKD